MVSSPGSVVAYHEALSRLRHGFEFRPGRLHSNLSIHALSIASVDNTFFYIRNTIYIEVRKMKNKIIATLFVSCLVASVFALVISEPGSDAAGSFTIKDYSGKDVTFNAPAEHVILLGYGHVLSAVELGCVDKIAAVDNTSATNMKESGITLEGIGSIFGASGRTQAATAIMQMSDKGKFNLETDWIIAPHYPSYTPLLVNELDKTLLKGKYKMISIIDDYPNYDKVIESIRSLGKIMGADSTKVVNKMESVKNNIAGVVKNKNLSSAPVIHLSSTEKVYNTSLITTMVEDILKGVNVGKDLTKTGSSYSSDRSAILQMASKHTGTVIFIDAGYTGDMNSLKGALPGYNIVQMTREGNNTGPQLADGLWTVASTVYPDHFSGDAPDGAATDNTMTYLIVGVVLAVLAIVAAYFLLRKP